MKRFELTEDSPKIILTYTRIGISIRPWYKSHSCKIVHIWAPSVLIGTVHREKPNGGRQFYIYLGKKIRE